MKISGNTVLITGGSSGIGLALAERFVAAGNEVIVTGRRASALEEVRRKLPSVITEVSDSGSSAAREKLVADLTGRFPALDVVIHNAGIQRKVDLLSTEPWEAMREEIAINLEGPIHMASLVLPHLRTRERAVLVNVTSGLAFVPLATVPVYSATKAALHSFTLSLRHQLRGTRVEVVEVIPPAVRSNLGGSHDFGVDTAEYADSVMTQLAEGRPEVTYQFSQQSSQASRAEADAMFARLNPRE
jgi:uncharacterized oxidoreductase